jgi:hypothetical protein
MIGMYLILYRAVRTNETIITALLRKVVIGFPAQAGNATALDTW